VRLSLFSTLSLLLLLPSSASALRRQSVSGSESGLTISSQTVRYKIYGRTAAALRAQMDRLGPIDEPTGTHFDGYANWTFYWSIRHRTSAGRCRVTTASILLELKYTLPRWQRSSNASATLVRRWNRYLKALRRHERGHGTIAIEAGRKMVKNLRLLDPRSSCSRLEKAADGVGRQGVARLNKVEAAYDAKTNHGTTQGAHFP
jgi:predicted secreted Zn-dependent protease